MALDVREESEGIVEVWFNRPPVNALDPDPLIEFSELFEGFPRRDDLRCVVLTAHGRKAFTAGQDLTAFRKDLNGLAARSDPGARGRRPLDAIAACPVPVILAANGPVIGGGIAIAAFCDIIIAAEGVTFSTPEINVGLLGASSHLAHLVGPRLARAMYLTGSAVDASMLAALGAVWRVTPYDELMPTAREIARGLAGKSPVAIRLAKQAMQRTRDLPLEQAYRLEQDYTTLLQGFEDAAEARNAFLEKRPPHWRGQ
jgi:enoyl-CoA hydratase